MSTCKLNKLQTKQYWAAILAVEGIGRKTLQRIIECLAMHEVSLADFWAQKSAQIWSLCQLTALQQHNLREFQKRFTPESYYGWLLKQNITLISKEDKEYPKLLLEIDDKPFILYAKGSLFRVNDTPIAVVGTRQVSGYGRQVIAQIVPDLVAAQATIISGFMYGVDTLAHQQALQHGGYTVGVLGFGFHHLYPASNRRFFAEMLEKGSAFLTEYPPWVGSHKGHFPERNRLVAGMSWATVVIEAAARSGSHITANCAARHGRSVCAVPGPISNPYSEGTKWLVNEGAKLVSSARDILEETAAFEAGWSKFVSMPQNKSRAAEAQSLVKQLNFADTIQEKIYQFICENPCSGEVLQANFAFSPAQLNIYLSLLELEGYIEKKDELWFIKTVPRL